MKIRLDVTHRGETATVVFTDHGYEPDTGAHDITWTFEDTSLNEAATDEEQESVLQQIYEFIAEDCGRSYCDDSF